MQLTVRDVSKLMNVSERSVYRWIKQKAIPVYRVLDQFRFNRAELLEWALSKKIPVNPDFFQSGKEKDLVLPTLSEVIKTGGIYYRVSGDTKESVFKSIVELLRLPGEFDQDLLIRLLCAREEIASTGVGDGIAIPHVRNPIVLNVPFSMVSLCFLENPIDFGALDKNPVNCIFMVISQTVRIHLHLLSRIAFCLHDAKFKKALLSQSSREEIEHQLRRMEENLK
ncbi:MAG: PTS sugar transporter subunit IIA [Candidatus Aureabacteria bacterium]|nr:PTS sugar transporter subunit IIA [Candidatus Auribacterota bacterium]